MKKVLLVIAPLSLILILAYNFYIKNPYVESTNLSSESISGIALMTKFDQETLEQVLGKTNKIYQLDKESITNYEYYMHGKYHASVSVNNEGKIVRIFSGLIDEKIKTVKGISKTSTFTDIERAYGDNYIKMKNFDFMGSGTGISVIYRDKTNNSQLSFLIDTNDEKEVLSSIELEYINE